MTPIVAFILGLLVGWLVEWVIDWLYWRRRYRRLQTSAEDCQSKLSAVETELSVSRNIYPPLQEQVSELELEKAQLEIQLSQTRQELEALRTQPPPPQPAWEAAPTRLTSQEPDIPDDLQEINGIGLVISKRLNNHGIFTFEQLAAQTPESLREIVGDMAQRLSNEESLLEQARQFALRKQGKGADGQ